MNRYEKLSSLDSIANFLYITEYDGGKFCLKSPLRIDKECPVDEEDVCYKNCIKCAKAWLMEEED